MNKAVLITTGIALALSGFSFVIPEGTLGREGISYSSGSLPGYTGSPSDGKTCTSCHSGTAAMQEGWISSDIPVDGYVPGENYTITATVQEAGVSKFGFQVSPQNAAGNLMGTMKATTNTQLVGQGKYVTHRLGSTAGTDSKSWTFEWTAPAAGSGDVTFYGAFNATNGNNSVSGDKVYTSTLTVSENPAAAVAEVDESNLQIYPNPNSGKFRIQYFLKEDQFAQLAVYNMSGQLIQKEQANYLELSDGKEIDLSNEPLGVYLVQLSTESNKTITKKLVIQ